MKTNNTETQIRDKLFSMQDPSYRDFNAKLIPTVSKDTIIGVRTPDLRKLAKSLKKSDIAFDFMQILPHKYYEENTLHGLLIEQIDDYFAAIAALNTFLPYVDNWATCDLVSPKIFKKHLPKLLEQIKIWIKSEHAYTVRFGIEMLMRYYLDDAFKCEYLDMIAQIQSKHYYVKMMIAWFFATALAKQYSSALPYIENCLPDKWIHNKAIQKAIESYRITPEQKAYLRTLKQ